MKSLKFSEPLPNLILKGEKTSTWRINDDKDIKKNDELCLCYLNGEKFAKAKVILVKETKFKDLTENDFKGHENYSSKEEMYKIYSKYYNINVNENTKVKIIKFQCL
ncbi:ASCH domain-containing protein [Candidatus Woesearchaeota archaeon]|nr:ASCH domain-containing protein [Candidatus Woesearchaeota archaeon]